MVGEAGGEKEGGYLRRKSVRDLRERLGRGEELGRKGEAEDSKCRGRREEGIATGLGK